MTSTKTQNTGRALSIILLGTALAIFSIPTLSAQATGSPQGITQATVLNFKNVKTECKSAVDFAFRRASEAETGSRLSSLQMYLDSLSVSKETYKNYRKLKGNFQGLIDEEVADFSDTMYRIETLISELLEKQRLGGVFDTYQRCLQNIERLARHKLPFDQNELDQIIEPYKNLVRSFSTAKQILAEFKQLQDEELKLSPAPASATPEEQEEALARASLKAAQILISQN